MSVHEVDAPARPEAVVPLPHGGRGVTERGGDGDLPPRGFADRWPFRRKLNVLVGVPLVVVALLLAYVISGLVGQARDAASAATLVRDSRQVAELVDRVETEHQQALLLSVRYESATAGTGAKRPSLSAYRQAQAAVDAQVGRVRTTFGGRLPEAEAQILRELNGLGSLRSTIEQSYLPADNIDPTYTAMVDGLIDGLGLDDGSTLSTTRTGALLDSLLRAEAAHSAFETSVFSAQTADANALIEFNNAVGYEQLYAYQVTRFGRFGTDAQRSELGGIERGAAWNAISMQYAGLQIDPSALETTDPGRVTGALSHALAAYPGYRQQAQNRLAITGDLIGQIAGRARTASSDAWWRAAWLLGATLLAFALWLAFSVAVRRSVVRPVQALTGAAAEVAEVAGRELARVADDDAADVGPPRLREVPVTARDEIGDLAEAFNRVQGSAAALLERQVLSRRNVAEMFGNVGRRVSNLTARQLALIDAVERGETDPELLDRLYRIDHLAVRLQRNADSLMLLAGIREAGLDAGPTELTNVVRAALGQIEGYQRVSLHAVADVTLAPDIVADLTLMLAELLENAVAFSPAHSHVEVSVREGADGAAIEIADHGLGMSAERLAEENARLVRRERLDLVPTKVLGLFVVGSLARRWGIHVTLTRTPGGGVTSRVVIPPTLLLLMSPFAEAPPVTPPTAPSAPSGPVPGEPAPPDPATPLPRRARSEPGRPAAAEHARPALPAAAAPVRPALPAAPAAGVATEGRRPAWAVLPEQPDRTDHADRADQDTEAARPLRRRVRGATLHTTLGENAPGSAPQRPRVTDAEEVRSSLDEFEAAIARAHRDTAADTGGGRRGTDSHDQNNALQEGAEQ
ncbi:ATP-binding protein [Streptomyces sp. V4-01]|uniref:histidine kinase n=1 Tax=Actinacidiphila polyblastidii TaxID=3110430 RepID=A0ABU7PBX4_9ACTN|nr:ATP-binding protein [Streptomyces sp. V4-01]